MKFNVSYVGCCYGCGCFCFGLLEWSIQFMLWFYGYLWWLSLIWVAGCYFTKWSSKASPSLRQPVGDPWARSTTHLAPPLQGYVADMKLTGVSIFQVGTHEHTDVVANQTLGCADDHQAVTMDRQKSFSQRRTVRVTEELRPSNL